MVSTGAIGKWGAILIGIIILFAALAALYPEAADAGDQLNESNLCADVGCYYNASGSPDTCQVSITNLTGCTRSAGDGFPLGSLLAGGGVVFVILAAGVLFVVLKKKHY